MALSPNVRSVIAGVLMANCAPHLATAVAGRQHLTPLAGRDSSPAVNLVWAAANLLGGALVLRGAAPSASPAAGTTGWSPSRPDTWAGRCG